MDEEYLSGVNLLFIKGICEMLGIDTEISLAEEFELIVIR
jgi:hypothetical protein